MDFSVEKIARLAYLELNPKERESFHTQFAEIIKYVDQLQEVKMTASEAAAMGAFHVSTAFYQKLDLDPMVTLREEADSAEVKSLIFTNDEAVRNAPQTGGIPGELLYAVPSIIER